MNKPLFMKIVHRLSTEVEFIRQKQDAIGRSSLSPLQKCTASIRVLAYGSAADAVDEYLRLGSIDCMHWEWKNCPTAWKGQYSRGSSKPTIVLEAVASYDLWIWHAFLGPPGTLNDINVLDRSPVFDDIINGQAPQVTYSINGREYRMAYYLTDARFAIVKSPALFWDKAKIGKITRACIILHNMIVENERDGYNLYNVSEFQQGEDSGSSHVDLTYSTDTPSNIQNMMSVRTTIRDRQKHERLKDDLVKHLWQKFGGDEDNN
uniref:Uncharacterized protein n=1 Tax=Brassica oleracea var. oleracea TaxID=109376 RepID=A0A0D3AE12_BRAOL